MQVSKNICNSIDCVFSCKELQRSTSSLGEAIRWDIEGFETEFIYKGSIVGKLNYCGEIEDFDEVYDLPDAPGSVYFVKAQNAYYIDLPE